MKKYYAIAIVAAFMLIAGKANAQVSVHAGYQHPIMSDGFFSLKYNGFYVGGSYNIHVANNIGVAPGACLTYASFTYYGDKDTEIDLRIPILANYGIDVNRDLRLFGFAGPMAGINLLSDAGVKRFDLGVMFGAGARYQKISAEIGYNIGVLNRNDDEDYKVTMNHFFVGLGYSF